MPYDAIYKAGGGGSLQALLTHRETDKLDKTNDKITEEGHLFSQLRDCCDEDDLGGG